MITLEYQKKDFFVELCLFSVLNKFQSQIQGNQPLVFKFIFQIPSSCCNFSPYCRSQNAEHFGNIWKVHAALPTSAHWFTFWVSDFNELDFIIIFLCAFAS